MSWHATTQITPPCSPLKRPKRKAAEGLDDEAMKAELAKFQARPPNKKRVHAGGEQEVSDTDEKKAPKKKVKAKKGDTAVEDDARETRSAKKLKAELAQMVEMIDKFIVPTRAEDCKPSEAAFLTMIKVETVAKFCAALYDPALQYAHRHLGGDAGVYGAVPPAWAPPPCTGCSACIFGCLELTEQQAALLRRVAYS